MLTSWPVEVYRPLIRFKVYNFDEGTVFKVKSSYFRTAQGTFANTIANYAVLLQLVKDSTQQEVNLTGVPNYVHVQSARFR